MNRRTLASWAGAVGIALVVMAGPAPAGATTSGAVIPGPCIDCTNHNQQPGNGPGIFTVLHACDTDTGEGMDTFFLGNPTATPVPYTLHSLAGTAADPGAIQATFSGVIPAAVGKKVGEAVFVAKDLDRNGVIVIAGTIGSRMKAPEQFNCPCLTPDTITTSPPSSAATSTSGSSIPGTTPAGTVTTSPHGGSVPVGTLPQTGADSSTDFGIAGLLLVGCGVALVVMFRRGRNA